MPDVGKDGQVVEIGARQAERALFPVQCDPGFATKVFATLFTGCFASGDEYCEIVAALHWLWPFYR
jgi:hypothetical protein